jgi:hypothetical protein
VRCESRFLGRMRKLKRGKDLIYAVSRYMVNIHTDTQHITYGGAWNGGRSHMATVHSYSNERQMSEVK